MKKSEFRQLIREEIKNALREYKDLVEYMEYAVEKIFKNNLKLKLEETIDVRFDNTTNKDFPYVVEVKFTDPTRKYKNNLKKLLVDFNAAAVTLKFPIEADVKNEIFDFGGNGIRLFLKEKK